MTASAPWGIKTGRSSQLPVIKAIFLWGKLLGGRMHIKGCTKMGKRIMGSGIGKLFQTVVVANVKDGQPSLKRIHICYL